MSDKKKLYLALPYSDPDPETRRVRFKLANEMAAKLLEQGYNVFSPISHSHLVSLYMENSNDSDFWCDNSLEWLRVCDEMVVYRLPGWRESKGVKREISFAQELNIPVRYLGDE